MPQYKGNRIMKYSINDMPSTALMYPPGLLLARGLVDKHVEVQKYGHNHAVGTAYAPVCVGGIYRTPQVGSETSVRIKAGGHANDTAAGTGAREVTIYGVDRTGSLVQEAIATNGESASLATTQEFLRIFKAKVTKSGTYATALLSSHAASIVIEDAAGSEIWLTIPLEDGIGHSRSQIGVYPITTGMNGYLEQIQIDVASNKTVDVILFKRNNFLETSAPYSPMEVIQEFPALTGSNPFPFKIPLDDFGQHTDIGFMAKAPQSSAITVKFTITCIEA